MTRLNFLPRLLIVIAFAAAAPGWAQQPDYEPKVGQPGKDVVWVPTPLPMVERMLDVAKVTREDYVMDLGSGDGRNVIAAARRGARALGVEFNPDLVELSRRAAASAGVGDKAQFVQGDMYAADISEASVMALFLLPDNLRRLLPKFLDLKPGSRIVVNFFGIEGWQPEDTVRLTSDCEPWCLIMLYIVPAKVAGTWRLPQGELTLTQLYQAFVGDLNAGGTRTEITGGRLEGDRIRFKLGDAEYTGTVSGDRMSGQISAPGSARGTTPATWTATRTSG